MDRQKLIEKCVAREASAWDEFVRQKYGLVLKCVRYKLRKAGMDFSRTLAEDMAQEMFMMLWESNRLSKVKNAASVDGWLAVVTINFVSSLLQLKAFKKDRRTFSLDACLQDTEDLSYMSGLSKRHSPETSFFTASSNDLSLDSRDICDIVGREISKLVPKQALALKLNLLEGLAQKDIAALLKIPENTVATLIKRGKSRLAKRLRSIL
jgi:RNA polymerase sigma factor (sigma-70 family)